MMNLDRLVIVTFLSVMSFIITAPVGATARMVVADFDSGCWIDAAGGTMQYLKYPSPQPYSFALAFCQSNHARLIISDVELPAYANSTVANLAIPGDTAPTYSTNRTVLLPWTGFRRLPNEAPIGWYDAAAGEPIPAAYLDSMTYLNRISGDLNASHLCTVLNGTQSFGAGPEKSPSLVPVDCASVHDVVCERPDPSFVAQWFVSPFPSTVSVNPTVAFGVIARPLTYDAAKGSCRAQEAELAPLPLLSSSIWQDAIIPAFRSTSGVMWQGLTSMVNPLQCEAAPGRPPPGFFTSYNGTIFTTEAPASVYDDLFGTKARAAVNCQGTIFDVVTINVPSSTPTSVDCNIHSKNVTFPALCMRRLIRASYAFNVQRVGFYEYLTNTTVPPTLGGSWVYLTVSIDPAPVLGPITFVVLPYNASVGVPLAAAVTFTVGGPVSMQVPFAVVGPGNLSAIVRGQDPFRASPFGAPAAGGASASVTIINDLTVLDNGERSMVSLFPGHVQSITLTLSSPVTRLLTIIPTWAWAMEPCFSISPAFFYPGNITAVMTVAFVASSEHIESNFCNGRATNVSLTVIPSIGVVWADNVHNISVVTMARSNMIAGGTMSYVMEQAGSTINVTVVFPVRTSTDYLVSLLNVTEACAPYLVWPRGTSQVLHPPNQALRFPLTTRSEVEYRLGGPDLLCKVWFTTNVSAAWPPTSTVITIKKRLGFLTSFPTLVSSTANLQYDRSYRIALPTFLPPTQILAVIVAAFQDSPTCAYEATCIFNSSHRSCSGDLPTTTDACWSSLSTSTSVVLSYDASQSTPQALGAVLPWEQQDNRGVTVVSVVPTSGGAETYSARVRRNAPREEAYIGVPFGFNVSVTDPDFTDAATSFDIIVQSDSTAGTIALCWMNQCLYNFASPIPLTITPSPSSFQQGFLTWDTPVTYKVSDGTVGSWNLFMQSSIPNTGQEISVDLHIAPARDTVRLLFSTVGEGDFIFPNVPRTYCFALNGSLVNGSVSVIVPALNCVVMPPPLMPPWEYQANEPYWARGVSYDTRCVQVVWEGTVCLTPGLTPTGMTVPWSQQSSDAAYGTVALPPTTLLQGTILRLTNAGIFTDAAVPEASPNVKLGYTWRLNIQYFGAAPVGTLAIRVTVQSPCCLGCIPPYDMEFMDRVGMWPIIVTFTLSDAMAVCPPYIEASLEVIGGDWQRGCIVEGNPVRVPVVARPILIATGIDKGSGSGVWVQPRPAVEPTMSGVGGIGTQLALLPHQMLVINLANVGGPTASGLLLSFNRVNAPTMHTFMCSVSSLSVGLPPQFPAGIAMCQWATSAPLPSVGFSMLPMVRNLNTFDYGPLGPLTTTSAVWCGVLSVLPPIQPVFTSMPMNTAVVLGSPLYPPLEVTLPYLPSSLEGISNTTAVQISARTGNLARVNTTTNLTVYSSPFSYSPGNCGWKNFAEAAASRVSCVLIPFVSPTSPWRLTPTADIVMRGLQGPLAAVDITTTVVAPFPITVRNDFKLTTSSVSTTIPMGLPYVITYVLPPIPWTYPASHNSFAMMFNPPTCGTYAFTSIPYAEGQGYEQTFAPLAVTITPYCPSSTFQAVLSAVGYSFLATTFNVVGTPCTKVSLACDSTEFIGSTDRLQCSVSVNGIWTGAKYPSLRLLPPPGVSPFPFLYAFITMVPGAATNPLPFPVTMGGTPPLWTVNTSYMVNITLAGSSGGATAVPLPLTFYPPPTVLFTPIAQNRRVNLTVARLPKLGRQLVVSIFTVNSSLQILPYVLIWTATSPPTMIINVTSSVTGWVDLRFGTGSITQSSTAVEFITAWPPLHMWVVASTGTASLTVTATLSTHPTKRSSSSSVSSSMDIRHARFAATQTLLPPPHHTLERPSHHTAFSRSTTAVVQSTLGVLSVAVQTAVTSAVVGSAITGGAISGAAVSRTLASISQAQRCITVIGPDTLEFPQSVIPSWRLGADSVDRPQLPYYRAASIAGMLVLLGAILVAAIIGGVLYAMWSVKLEKLTWYQEATLRAPAFGTNALIGLLLDGCVSGGTIAVVHGEGQYFAAGLSAPLIFFITICICVVLRPSRWYPGWLVVDQPITTARVAAQEILSSTWLGKIFVLLNGVGAWGFPEDLHQQQAEEGPGKDLQRRRVHHLLTVA